jgi:hypothetical protein
VDRAEAIVYLRDAAALDEWVGTQAHQAFMRFGLAFLADKKRAALLADPDRALETRGAYRAAAEVFGDPEFGTPGMVETIRQAARQIRGVGVEAN